MKIMRVSIVNFKNLRKLEKEIKGKNILLLADNEKGKSSFMQAIRITLGSGDMPPTPITHGEQNGQIEVVTDENGNEYTFRMTFQEGKKPMLEVIAPNGLRDNRKSAIGSIVGEIDFDLHKFVTMSETTAGRKEQIKIIRSLLPEEVQRDLNEHEDRIEMHFETRANINREIKALKGFIEESGLQPLDFKMYENPVDTQRLQSDYNKQLEENAKIQGVKDRFETRKDEITRINDEIKRLQDQKSKQEVDQANAEKYLDKNKIKDTEAKQHQLNTANEHNIKHSRVKDFAAKMAELTKREEESGELTALIDSSREALADAVRNDIEMPVPDLTFNEDTLLYKGQEVNINTLATSQIMHLGIQLKMAQHPNVKVLFIENGESLGIKKLKQIQDLCKEFDYQIIMEQVERGTDELKIEIMPKY